ncbi:hypothetical protein B0H11DRAFT_1909217 [Mycena galericulata]|nr:hypothetical protein B0H11DRAFT_1909217 [Mycena galericulata]
MPTLSPLTGTIHADLATALFPIFDVMRFEIFPGGVAGGKMRWMGNSSRRVFCTLLLLLPRAVARFLMERERERGGGGCGVRRQGAGDDVRRRGVDDEGWADGLCLGGAGCRYGGAPRGGECLEARSAHGVHGLSPMIQTGLATALFLIFDVVCMCFEIFLFPIKEWRSDVAWVAVALRGGIFGHGGSEWRRWNSKAVASLTLNSFATHEMMLSGTSHGAFKSKQYFRYQSGGSLGLIWTVRLPVMTLEALDMSVRTTQMECPESLSWSDSSTPGEKPGKVTSFHTFPSSDELSRSYAKLRSDEDRSSVRRNACGEKDSASLRGKNSGSFLPQISSSNQVRKDGKTFHRRGKQNGSYGDVPRDDQEAEGDLRRVEVKVGISERGEEGKNK